MWQGVLHLGADLLRQHGVLFLGANLLWHGLLLLGDNLLWWKVLPLERLYLQERRMHEIYKCLVVVWGTGGLLGSSTDHFAGCGVVSKPILAEPLAPLG